MNMKKWAADLLAADKKLPMPVLSFPSVTLLGIGVKELISDPELQAIQAYDVWKEKKLYGKVSMGVVRTTYIIDEQGNIEKAMPKVKPDTNAAEILEYLTGEEKA